MFPFLIKAKDAALDILFPPICINCQKTIEDRNKLVCAECSNSIRFNDTLFCPTCRARLPENKKICHFDSQYLLAAAGNYSDPILQNLIQTFKYRYFQTLAPVLGEILLIYLEKSKLIPKLTDSQTILIPIPLHLRKERQRGFNQSKLLAQFLAQKLNMELVYGLKRVKNTEPQAKIKEPEERIKNIAGCFEIKNSAMIQNRNILLIDDVFTSGSTINEAVRILKSNHSGKIITLVLAKA